MPDLFPTTEEAAQEQARANAKRKGRPPPVDNDPLGEQLLKVPDHLAEAAKHIRKVYNHNTKRIEVQLTAFDVFFHQSTLPFLHIFFFQVCRISTTSLIT